MSIRPDYDCPPIINYSEMYWEMFKLALPDSDEANKSIELIMKEHHYTEDPILPDGQSYSIRVENIEPNNVYDNSYPEIKL